MLVLSRYADEELVLVTSDGLIVVKVTDVRGAKVKIGVDAPPDVAVYRREVWEIVKHEQNGDGR